MASFYLDQVDGKLAFKFEERAPLPTPTSRVLIIGGSVTGLTTAWSLLDAGYAVTIVSDQWAPALPRITAQVAGALFVFALFLSNSRRLTTFANVQMGIPSRCLWQAHRCHLARKLQGLGCHHQPRLH